MTESKIETTKGLIQKGSYMKKESSYDFLESESEKELNQELINEIKINNFDVNKPKEQNMKYTLYKEFKEENENENESSKPESHLSKIIIGEIESYKDIIEKDKINVKNNLNINKDKNELITVPVDDSIESEKFIINMKNIENKNNLDEISNKKNIFKIEEEKSNDNVEEDSNLIIPDDDYIESLRQQNENNNKEEQKYTDNNNEKNQEYFTIEENNKTITANNNNANELTISNYTKNDINKKKAQNIKKKKIKKWINKNKIFR